MNWLWVQPGDHPGEEEWELRTPEGMAKVRPAQGVALEKLLRAGPPTPSGIGGNLEPRPVVMTVHVSIRDQIGRSLWVGPSLGALLALGEEIGWRGYLLGELLPLGFWRSSLLIGVVWGLWHAPGIFLGSRVYFFADPIADLLAQVATTLLLSPLLSWIRIRSGTVLAAAIFHGGVNAATWLLGLYEPRDSWNGATMVLAGVLVLLAAWAAIAFLDRSTVRGVPRAAPEASQGRAP
ncbi:MAG: CPBP family intramembrane metalloprotease [Planctomycetes bacterium]|nr:CPBP family intramembrane metalloprotease [Planctomycetota bacterium]